MAQKNIYLAELISHTGEGITNEIIKAVNVIEAHEKFLRSIKEIVHQIPDAQELVRGCTIKTNLVRKGA